MYEFKCFSELAEEIKYEKEVIEDFTKYSEQGDCILLPNFTKIFKGFRHELLNNTNLFFSKPFNVELYDQSKRKYPARSSMVKSCPKQIFLSYHDANYDNKIPKDSKINPTWTDSADIGNFCHGLLQRYFSLFGLIDKDENGEYLIEKRIDDEKLLLTGHIDFIGTFKKIYNIDLNFIGEIKTTGSNRFINTYNDKSTDYHKIDKVIKNETPVLDHLIQANLYLYEEDLQYELFYYCDRGNTDLDAALLYRRNDELIEKLITKLKSIKQHHIKKTIPSVKKMSDARCKFCRYTAVCKDIKTIKDIEKLCKG